MIGNVKTSLAILKRRFCCYAGGGPSRFLRFLATGANLWPDTATFSPEFAESNPRFKVLLVAAHPDDESECAAVLYRTAHELGGAVDHVVVTNGEAGHQYSAPAQAYYRVSLSGAGKGRQRHRGRHGPG